MEIGLYVCCFGFFVVACVWGALHLLLTILVFFFTLFVIRRGWRFFLNIPIHIPKGKKQIACVCGSPREGRSIRRDKRLKFEGTFFSPLSFSAVEYALFDNWRI